MCDFLSVLVNKDCDSDMKIYVGDLRSHSYTAELHRLKPGTYREVEWTNDGENTLRVRIELDDHPENWYRACILAKWPSRAHLIEYCLKNLPENIGTLDLSGCSLPPDLKFPEKIGNLYLRG